MTTNAFLPNAVPELTKLKSTTMLDQLPLVTLGGLEHPLGENIYFYFIIASMDAPDLNARLTSSPKILR
jgi:hypothetical protein